MSNVKLIAVTQPLIKIKKGNDDFESPLTAEEFIAYTARVSNPSNQVSVLTGPQLIKYCINHRHWSIFEQCFLTLEVTTTRDIGRQILRHRSFTFQEFSARYADPTKELGFVTREARLQDHKNRQNSIEFEDVVKKQNWELKQNHLQHTAEQAYRWAIENGIAKEVARSVLPEGLITTKMYISGSLRSFIHWIDVRAEEGTQKEHREIAIAAREEILKHFPSLSDYWFEQEIKETLEKQPRDWWGKWWS